MSEFGKKEDFMNKIKNRKPILEPKDGVYDDGKFEEYMEIDSDEMAAKRVLFELGRNSYRKYKSTKPKTFKEGDIINIDGNLDGIDDGEYEVITVGGDDFSIQYTLRLIKLAE